MSAVIKVINQIKANSKTERLFKIVCKDTDKDYIRLLLHTQVRWLSSGQCLDRFDEMYDAIFHFCGDHDIFKPLRNDDARYIVKYLTDIFGKLNMLNDSGLQRLSTWLQYHVHVMWSSTSGCGISI